jgi:hypothetical protein
LVLTFEHILLEDRKIAETVEDRKIFISLETELENMTVYFHRHCQFVA